MRKWSILVPLTVLFTSQADAQQTGKGGDRLVADVTQCRSVSNDTERLACFDRSASALEAARNAKTLVVMDREDIRNTRRSLFGFNLPQVNLFGRNGEDEPEISEISSSIAELTPSGRDRWIVRLKDGSTWKTLEATIFDPRIGTTALIKRAALGSYMGSFSGRASVRVQRVQ